MASSIKLHNLVARKGLIELKNGVPPENPVSAVPFLDEQNIRDRILTPEEFERMLNAAPEYLKPILLCAYRTVMRRGEILNLTWDRVDLKSGFTRLKESDTKTGEARSIPLTNLTCSQRGSGWIVTWNRTATRGRRRQGHLPSLLDKI